MITGMANRISPRSRSSYPKHRLDARRPRLAHPKEGNALSKLRKRRVILALATTATAAGLAASFSFSAANAATVPDVQSGTGWFAVNGPAPSNNYSSYTFAIFQAWQGSAASAAKSQGAVVAEYKDLTSTRSDDCGTSPGGGSDCIVNGVICPSSVNDAANYAAGLGFCWAWRNHPEWFLTTDGSTATSSTPSSDLVWENGYNTQAMMDWGNKAYQDAWAASVIKTAQANGFQYVFADNALMNPTAYTNQPLVKYPTAQAVQNATQSMLAEVGPQLQAAGIGFIPNLGYTDMYPGVWAQWLPYVSGFMNQHDVGAGVKTQNGTSNELQDEHNACQQQGKVCLFDNTGTTIQVVASSSAPASAPSSTPSSAPSSAPPAAPVGLSHQVQEKVSWQSVTGATSYHLQVVNGSGTVVKDRTTSNTSYTFTNLSQKTSYSWKVQATSGTGTSSYATGKFQTGS
jgi:Hypothetical glycosyl hydrolase family 15